VIHAGAGDGDLVKHCIKPFLISCCACALRCASCAQVTSSSAAFMRAHALSLLDAILGLVCDSISFFVNYSDAQAFCLHVSVIIRAGSERGVTTRRKLRLHAEKHAPAVKFFQPSNETGKLPLSSKSFDVCLSINSCGDAACLSMCTRTPDNLLRYSVQFTLQQHGRCVGCTTLPSRRASESLLTND
jgi:hypothetical protein